MWSQSRIMKGTKKINQKQSTNQIDGIDVGLFSLLTLLHNKHLEEIFKLARSTGGLKPTDYYNVILHT